MTDPTTSTIVPGQEPAQWQPPSVDEVIPTWTRAPGKRGRKTKDELAAEAANQAAREAYQRAVDELMNARAAAESWRTTASEQTTMIDELKAREEHAVEHVGEWQKSYYTTDDQRQQDRQAAVVFATVTAQLARQAGMDVTEVTIDPSTTQLGSVLYCKLASSDTTYSVKLTDRKNGNVEVAIEQGRIMMFLVGSEGLSDEQQSAVRAYFLRKQHNTPRSTSLSGKDTVAALITLLTLAKDCGNPSCPIHGKSRSSRPDTTRLLQSLGRTALGAMLLDTSAFSERTTEYGGNYGEFLRGFRPQG